MGELHFLHATPAQPWRVEALAAMNPAELGEAFRGCLPVGDQLLDCGCALEHGAFDTFNGSVEVVSKEGALIYFLFRLLSKLQTLGTVPAIDWTVYAGVINRRTFVNELMMSAFQNDETK